MDQGSEPATSRANRRASRRSPLRTTIKVECRKGGLGLGPNLVVRPLDMSERGVRLVLKVALAEGQEVEVLILGGGSRQPLKCLGHIVWSLPTENNHHVVGVRFDGCVPFADLQGMTRPAPSLG
jgi:hypothetical protein